MKLSKLSFFWHFMAASGWAGVSLGSIVKYLVFRENLFLNIFILLLGVVVAYMHVVCLVAHKEHDGSWFTFKETK